MKRRAEIKDESISSSPLITPRAYKMGKRWKAVSDKTHANNLKTANENVMNAYLAIIEVLKKHFLKPGTPYFERDYRDDNIDPYSCYSFVFEHGYLHLDCDGLCVMQILYDFTGYEFEKEIMKLLKLLIHLNVAFHRPQMPDLPTFFKAVIAYQDKQFFHTL